MKKIKIGIPRALLYHRQGVFWHYFFKTLGCNVVLSPETNKSIIDISNKYMLEDYCLSYKIYIGHVIYLSKICDYIFITRVCNHNNIVCPQFSAIYDNVKSLIPTNKIIIHNLKYNNIVYEISNIFKIGIKFSNNPIKIIYSYLLAKKHQKKYDISKENEEKNKLNKQNKKVLIISNFYNLRDKYISGEIINYLKSKNITPLLSSNLNKSISTTFSEYLRNNLSIKYSKEVIGALYYYQYIIDGVIYLSINNCGIDTLLNNLLILKNKHLKSINIVIGNPFNENKILTKLENFINLLGDINE